MLQQAWTVELPDADVATVLFSTGGAVYITTTESYGTGTKLDLADPSNPREWFFDADAMGSIHRIGADGRLDWSREGLSGLATVADEILLATDPDGNFAHLDHHGNRVGESPAQSNFRYMMWRGGEPLFLTDQERAFFLDPRSLQSRELGLLPQGVAPFSSWFVGGKFYWSEQNSIFRASPGGTAEEFAKISPALVEAAIERLAVRLDLWNRGPEARMGLAIATENARRPHWYIVDDQRRGRLFAYHNRDPYIVCSLTSEGAVEWCEVLGGGCCGYRPQYLGHDVYASSLACGGIVTWFDAEGQVLAQSEAGEDGTLASSLGGLAVTPDGKLVGIRGEGPILVWDRQGRLLGEKELHGFGMPGLTGMPDTEAAVVWSPVDDDRCRVARMEVG